MRGMESSGRRKPQPKPQPNSPTFYTARSTYYDQVVALENAIGYSNFCLRDLQLLPLPSFARASLPPPHYAWKSKTEMESFMHSTMTMSKYRRVLGFLNNLNDCRRIAEAAGCEELEEKLEDILRMFKKGSDGMMAKKKPVKIDEFGRTYTTGRRKTSAARVWIIATKHPSQDSIPEPEQSLETLLGLESPPPERPAIPVTTTTVLVNNLPLASYFTLQVDREKVIRPLKLAGVLGGYNVFALVRGGGTTGQSGAIAHGIAKGLAVHEPQMADILRKGESFFFLPWLH